MEYQLPPVSKLHMLLRHQKVENGRSEHMVAIEGLEISNHRNSNIPSAVQSSKNIRHVPNE